MGRFLNGEAARVAILCVIWYALSAASNVVGKLVLTGFPYPGTVVLVQLGTAVACSAPSLKLFRVRPRPRLPIKFWVQVLLPLAAAKFATTFFSQVSVWRVPVSYAHTVKASTPLWTAALARILFGEQQTRSVIVALAVIACGVCVASATEVQWDAGGLGAALASAALLSAQHLFSKRVLRDTGMHHLRLLEVLAGLALVMFAPVWWWREGDARPDARSAVLLCADGLLAWLQAVAAFSVLSRVSALAYGVASAAKRACVVAASLVLLGNPAPPLNLLGMALAAFGVLLYNRAKVRPSPTDLKPLLPI